MLDLYEYILFGVLFWCTENFSWSFQMYCNPKILILSILTELMGTPEFLISSKEFSTIVSKFNRTFVQDIIIQSLYTITLVTSESSEA